MSRESLVLRDTEITPQRVVQSVGTQLQDITKTEDEIRNNRPLAVLFSHSSRIRCFLDLLYPITDPSKSILEKLLERKKNPELYRQDLYKFNNCVIFLLKKVGSDYKLFMKSQGTNERRISLQMFGEMFNLSAQQIRDVGVKVNIKKGEKIDGYARISSHGMIDAIKRNILSNVEERGGEESLKSLLETKDLCIIRHGLSKHNEEGASHRIQDTSLTLSGMTNMISVATDHVIKDLFSSRQYPNKVIYISELLRTQQTAMIFVNCNTSEFHSTEMTPIRLIMIPCNHEFKESNIKRGACYHNQYERARLVTHNIFHLENSPMQDARRKRVVLQLNDVKSYFYRDDYMYDIKARCKKTVFYYILKNDDAYTDFYELADKDAQDAQRKKVNQSLVAQNPQPSTAISRGGSLKKKRKRRTIRRKSKRFTKKRNKRRTNKKRLTKRR